MASVRRNIVRRGDTWDLLATRCDRDEVQAPFFAVDQRVLALWTDGADIVWQQVADE